MIINYKKVINLTIYFKDNKLSKLKDIILDPTDGLFLFLQTRGGKYIKSEDIKEILNSKIILNKNNFIDKPQNGIKFSNLRVYTESGEYLGRVSDFSVDLNNNKLNKIYVLGGNIIKQLIRGELIISRNQIVSINKGKIIVKDIIARKKQFSKIIPEEEKELAGASFFIKAD